MSRKREYRPSDPTGTRSFVDPRWIPDATDEPAPARFVTRAELDEFIKGELVRIINACVSDHMRRLKRHLGDVERNLLKVIDTALRRRLPTRADAEQRADELAWGLPPKDGE